jgi:signal transduction histidine kinase/PAS domain-containing protein
VISSSKSGNDFNDIFEANNPIREIIDIRQTLDLFSGRDAEFKNFNSLKSRISELINTELSLFKIDIPIKSNSEYLTVVFWNQGYKDFSQTEKRILRQISDKLSIIISQLYDKDSVDIKQKMQDILEFVNDMAFIFDYNGNIVFSNQTAKDKLVIDDGEYRNINDFIEEQEHRNSILEKLINSPMDSKEIYLDFKSPIGANYPVRLLLSKFAARSQKLVLGIAKDINEENYIRNVEIKSVSDSELFKKISDFVLTLLEADSPYVATEKFIPVYAQFLQVEAIFYADYTPQEADYNFKTHVLYSPLLQHNSIFDAEENTYQLDENSEVFRKIHGKNTTQYFIEDAPQEIKDLMLKFDFGSLCVSPVFVFGKLHGVIGIINKKYDKLLSDSETYSLIILSNAIGASIERTITLRDVIQSREVAEQATKAKSDFLACMSHEIRTPLNAILGMTELLNMTTGDEEQLEFIEIIQSSADQLTEMINDILDLSGIENGEFTVEKKAFNFRDLIKKSVYTLAAKAFGKHIEIITDIDNSIPVELIGDAHRIRQIIVNILGNAVKYTNRGEIIIRMREVAKDKDYVRISTTISDSGIGIPYDKLNAIFESFGKANYSTASTNRGAGLGLAISKKLLEYMNGSISASSVLGVGSSFTFDFALPIANSKLSYSDPKNIENCKILIIESNISLLSSLKQYLSKVSDNIEFTSDYSKTSYTLNDKANYNIVIVGQNLERPETAYKALETIIAHTNSSQKLILAQASEPNKEQKEFLEMNNINCLHKPIFPEDLFAFIQN